MTDAPLTVGDMESAARKTPARSQRCATPAGEARVGFDRMTGGYWYMVNLQPVTRAALSGQLQAAREG